MREVMAARNGRGRSGFADGRRAGESGGLGCALGVELKPVDLRRGTGTEAEDNANQVFFLGADSAERETLGLPGLTFSKPHFNLSGQRMDAILAHRGRLGNVTPGGPELHPAEPRFLRRSVAAHTLKTDGGAECSHNRQKVTFVRR